MNFVRALVGSLLVFAASPAFAWFDMGHMIVTAVAYDQLQPDAKAKIAVLLKLNPDYQAWIADAPPDRQDKVAFVHAATWADDIKHYHDYISHPAAQDGPDAADNIGYEDHLVHPYWHYIDLPFSEDGSPAADPVAPNALTQIFAFRDALASSPSDDVKSYDLVWLEHLVGDAHQPLHAISRFSQAFPNGDNGGNAEKVCRAFTCGLKLHAFWDGVLGDRGGANNAIAAAANLDAADPNRANVSDPGAWFSESADLARQFVYTQQIGDGAGPFQLDEDYQANALKLARVQAALAGARLANLLTAALAQH